MRRGSGKGVGDGVGRADSLAASGSGAGSGPGSDSVSVSGSAIGSGAERPAGPRSNVTARAAVLALVVCLLAISLAYPLREYLTQRGDIGDYRAQVSKQATQVDQLEKQKRRWTSDTYVEAQARERLHYVLPGETAYIVLGGDDTLNTDGVIASAARPGVRSPWFTDLWRSVEAAGSTKAAATRP